MWKAIGEPQSVGRTWEMYEFRAHPPVHDGLRGHRLWTAVGRKTTVAKIFSRDYVVGFLIMQVAS